MPSSSKQRHPFRVVSSAVLLLGSWACSPPVPVVVDASLASGQSYEVDGLSSRYWGKPLKFGSFATEKTRVGERWDWAAGLFGVSAGERVQPYRFGFAGEAGEHWQVECRARTPIIVGRTDHGSWSTPVGETRLGCVMRAAGGEVRELQLHGTAFDLAGESALGADTITIRSLHELPDKAGRPHRVPAVLGYELRAGDRVVGSVDLLGKGRVYFASELSPALRNGVAMTATALLFFGRG